MSVAATVLSPISAAIGYVLLAKPARFLSLLFRFNRWAMRLVGLDWRATSAPLTWFYTPVHRWLLGDPATAFDRLCEHPEQFRVIILMLRADGIFLLFCSIVAAFSGALLFAEAI
jgi:hypothetical protein